MTSSDKHLEQWRQIVAHYQTPDLLRSIWQILNTFIPFFALWYLMILSLPVGYWLTLLLSVPTAGFFVRIFIIFHDCCHGSFFTSKKANELVGFITGIITLTSFHAWRRDHAIHHATAGNLDKRGVGDVPTLTVSEYLNLPWWKKISYRVTRNPIILFTIGAFGVFVFAHRFWASHAGKREKQSILWTNFFIALLYAALIWLVGWKAFLLVQIPILAIATSVGVWLFYVQHNYENVYWERTKKWDFLKAGLEGSSFYQLPAILQWFTGNIGFHHIHHLSPKIPNYMLPRCYKENPIFHIRPLTIWHSLKSLSLRLYDEQQRKLVGYGILRTYKLDKNF